MLISIVKELEITMHFPKLFPLMYCVLYGILELLVGKVIGKTSAYFITTEEEINNAKV